jgi:replicative DNA helicase
MTKRKNDSTLLAGGDEPPPFRELPNNIELEQQLIGSILVNNSAIDRVPNVFGPQHFHEPLHRRIFEVARDIIRTGKIANPVTIKTFLPSDEKVGDMTVSQYMAVCAGSAASVLMAREYAEQLILLSVGRDTIGFGEQAIEVGFNVSSMGEETTYLDQAEELRTRLDNLIMVARGEEHHRRTLAEATDQALGLTADAMSGKGVVGIDHGFAPLMSLIGPLIPGHLIVVGGATKQGKSSLIEQIIAGAAINGHHVWVYSGEMSAQELAARALSRLTDIQAWRQVQGRISEPEYDKLFSAGRSARKWMDHIHVEDKSMTLSQIDREIVRFKKRYPSCLAVVDHVGLVERDKNSFRMSEAEFGPVATQSLKMTARKSEVPILAAAQLKKNTFVQEGRTTKDTFFQAISRRPKYTDLIGACEKDANHVIIPFRAEPILQELEPAENSDLHPAWEDVMDRVRGKAEIRLALSRHRNWPQSREVVWNGPRTSFEEKAQSDQTRMPV